MNRKGQFSIIAALLVAIVLVAAVMATYSAIRYGSPEEEPQILSAIDETNLGIKELLGFTVGYYGSVLKVTGNMTYAQQLATNYLKSGLNNTGDVRPEWGVVCNLNSLTLNASWFSNQSYSRGSINVNYNLTGLGIYGISYSTSTSLDVKIIGAVPPNKTELVITRDEDEPLINLGSTNLKFYSFDYQTSTWNLASPVNIASYANGTYILDVPLGVISNAYVIEVSDTRGLMVLAGSFNQLTATLTWNSSAFRQEPHYIDEANLNVFGTHGNFSAQQSGPDGIYDTLTEQTTGTVIVDNYPSDWDPINTTSLVSGSLADLQSDNNASMQLQSYPVCFDSQNSAVLTSQASSLSWSHTTGTGNDRILLVAVDVCPNSGNPTSVSSVTYGGVTLTPLTSDIYNTSPRVRSYVYYLLNPSSGTKTITVTFGASTYAVGGSVTYMNINQTNPILANATNTGQSASQSVSVTASGANSKVLFGHLGSRASSAYNVTDGQTARWSQTGSLYKGFGSEKSVTSGSVSASWNTSSAVNWVAIAVLLQPTQTATNYVCEAEFMGSSNTETWNNIVWTVDGAATTNGVNVTYQLYNYRTGAYMTTGYGFLTELLGTSDITKTQMITSNLTDYRDDSGNWKIRINATQTTQFDLKLDMIRYSINQTNYAIDLQEQWTNVNASIVRQDLCIKTGNLSSEALIVQVWHGGSWMNLMTLLPNYFNNISLAPYIDSQNLKIRFVGGNDLTDSVLHSWNIDCVYLKDEPDVAFLVNRQQSTITLEVLQNGTIRWLGQNMQVTTQTVPIPPISVKAFHVNETINGVNQEVPFQIEDWASNYQTPLGLTSSTTVFSNRQMIVLLINSRVSDFTIWWDGKDNATQTSMAYTNRFFADNNYNATTPMLTNGNITLQFPKDTGAVNSMIGGTSTYSNATFMRINNETSTYTGAACVIHHGIVRDIVMQEAEWSGGGVDGCPNVYANTIITLPANSTYYTYQLRLTFINSTQPRAISNLCPIKLNSTLIGVQTQTENGTLAGFPLLQNGTATFPNYASGGWTAHHFSQFIQDTGKGAGIMFTGVQNQRLYAFDSIAGHSTGVLSANATMPFIELLPVYIAPATAFTYAYDVTWQGAVATFDGTTPVCSLYDGTTPTGLWILAEYPPMLTVTAKS